MATSRRSLSCLIVLLGVLPFIWQVPPEPYSLILIPDTQNYTGTQSGHPRPDDTYRDEMQWIADNRASHHIVAAIHLGDMTNSNGYPTNMIQWTVADAAHKILDASGMPYSVVPGNHDHRERVANEVLLRNVDSYATLFGRSRFANQPWFLPSHPFNDSRNANSAMTFEVGPWKYLVVSLDFAPTKDAVCWAAELIESMKDYRVIVATHSYLTMDTLLADGVHRGTKYSQNRRGAYNIVGMDGSDLWNELASLHSNIEMVVSGHIQGGAVYSPEPSSVGTTVHQILVDYQDERRPSHTAKHGNGWVKVVQITPSTGAVKVWPVRTIGTDTLPQFNAGGGKWDYSNDPRAWDHSFSFDLARTMSADAHRHPETFKDQEANIDDAGNQRRPAIGMNSSGDFLIVWEDDSEAPTGVYEIFGRRFAPDGCGRHSQFRVNVRSTRQQLSPDIELDDNGNAVVVWEDDSRGATGVYQIYVRGLGPTGAERFRKTVNSVATGNQIDPRVAIAPDGSFAVAWRDERSGTAKVFVRGYNADGSANGLTERQVLPGSTLAQRDPDVAILDNGDVVVVWESNGDVFGAGFGSDGTVRFAPHRLTDAAANAPDVSAPGWQGNPSVAAIGSSGFVATWGDCPGNQNKTAENAGCSGGTRQVVYQSFHSSGAPDGIKGVASAQNIHVSAHPRIGADRNGRFMIVWEDDSDNDHNHEIMRRTYERDGTAIDGTEAGPQRLNANPRGPQSNPAIVLQRLGGGKTKWVVTWVDDLDTNGKKQILTASGVF